MPKLQPKRKAALEKLLGESMSVCLEMPFIEAAQADRRRSLRAMSQAWISYLTNVQVTAPAMYHNFENSLTYRLKLPCNPGFILPLECSAEPCKFSTEKQGDSEMNPGLRWRMQPVLHMLHSPIR